MPNNEFKTTQVNPHELDSNDGWDGIDRRKMPRDGSEPLTKAEFEKRLSLFKHQTAEAINTRFALLEEKIIEKLNDLDKTLKSGFPNGDPVEHRKDHETKIKLDNERANLYKQIREKLITSAVWGMIVMIALAVWEYIKQNVHK